MEETLKGIRMEMIIFYLRNPIFSQKRILNQHFIPL